MIRIGSRLKGLRFEDRFALGWRDPTAKGTRIKGRGLREKEHGFCFSPASLEITERD